jgi:Zn finger protein HypA/HybF involved in hydrogenase expression
MHDLQFANEIIEKVEKIKKSGSIKSVVVEVGELAPISASSLKQTLKTLVKWKVKVISKKSVVKCDCGYEGPAKIIERQHSLVLFRCLKCGAIPKVLSGKEVMLKEVEVL